MKRSVLMVTAGFCLFSACGGPTGTVSREEATEICSRVLREQLTANEDVQEACLMLMDVRSGEVLAAVDMIAEQDGIRIDSLNQAFVRMSEPGPVFETATLAALLSDGCVRSLEDPVAIGSGVVKGTVIRDDSIIAYARNCRKDSLSVLEGFIHSDMFFLPWQSTTTASQGARAGKRGSKRRSASLTPSKAISPGLRIAPRPTSLPRPRATGPTRISAP